MRIVEIEKLSNGAHRNQSGNFTTVPKGWAVVPDDMEMPKFPFGEIEIAEVDGVMKVIEWVATEMPEVVEPPIEPPEPTTADILNALLGV